MNSSELWLCCPWCNKCHIVCIFQKSITQINMYLRIPLKVGSNLLFHFPLSPLKYVPQGVNMTQLRFGNKKKNAVEMIYF